MLNNSKLMVRFEPWLSLISYKFVKIVQLGTQLKTFDRENSYIIFT
jgi:hypothetical protein